MAHDVFISYAASDKTVADAVCARLESVHHVRCWIAPRDIAPGVSAPQVRLDALDQSKIMIVIFGSNEIASTQMEREVERAVHQGINVIPFRMPNAAASAAPGGVIGDPRDLDTLSAPPELRVSRLTDRVAALLATSLAPVGAAGPASWFIPGLVGAVLAVAVIVGALWLEDRLMRPQDDQISASFEASQAASTSQQAVAPATGTLADSPAPGSADSALSAASPVPAGASVSLSGVPSQTAPETGTAAASSSTPRRLERAPSPAEVLAAERAAAAEPPGGSAAVRTVPERAPAIDPATASRRAQAEAAEAAASSLAPSGTLLIDFINTYPDGSVEIEIDGHKQWSEKLRLDQTGVISRMLFQRASSQIGSELRVPVGDHQVTVTMLNAAGEVRDIGTTSLHVYASRMVTLRIRITRFKNRLQLESAAG